MTDRREAPRWDRLGPATAARLESAALQVLETTGVEVPVHEALDLLREAGATVEGSRARIPERLVTRALETAPKEITLHDRAGSPAVRLAGRQHYFGTGSDCLYILDHRTGERRRATCSDLAEGLTLADALPNIDFVMSMFLPRRGPDPGGSPPGGRDAGPDAQAAGPRHVRPRGDAGRP